MSKWTEQFNSHPFIGIWNSLVELVIGEDLDEKVTEESIQDMARLRKVIVFLNGIFEKIDPELTPINHIVNIQNIAQNCINELNAFKGNGNVGHLQNSNNHADQLILLFQQIPASIYAVSKESIKKSVTAYSETIGSYINKYRNETEENVIKLSNRIEQLNEEMVNKEQKLADLESELNTVEQTIQQQTSEFNTQYQNSEKDRSDKFDKAYEKHIDRSDDAFKNLSTRASKIIEVLAKFQDDASRVYDVTISTLQGGAYSSYANDERKIANKFRFFASILMLIGVGFLVIPELMLIYKNENYVFDWLKILGRIPLSLVVFVPAFYFARESGKHRTNEVTNRRRQHILTTLDPYIELMDTDKAQDLKSHVAKTVFSESNISGSEGNETGNILSQLANLAKQLKSN